MLCDIHTHSLYSFDGRDTVDALCRAAIARGVKVLAITDHAEALTGVPLNFKERERQLRQLQAVERAQEDYRGKLRILRACELGQPHMNPAYAQAFKTQFHFDYIIGSLHFFSGNVDLYDLRYTRENVRGRLATYFEDTLAMLEYGGFQSLGHLDYIMRLLQNCFDGSPTYRGYEAWIDPILESAAKQRMALEVNTSGLRKWMQALTMEVWVLRRFRELGGQYVTIGSDAHAAEDVGCGFSEACALLRRSGFDSYTYFIDQEPVTVPIA